MKSIFDILSALPLFKGISLDRLAATVGKIKFHFLKYSPGETIVEAGEQCTHLIFVLSGKVSLTITNSDDRFRISQTLQAPDVISPDYLFGTSTLYPGRVVAIDQVSIVKISKNDYMRILASDEIFIYNYMNYLSMNSQKCIEGVLAITNGSIEERLAFWVIAMTQQAAVDITIVCKQRDLYSMLGVQRSSYMAAIQNMVNRGLITYVPGTIKVKDRKSMLHLMRNGVE